jgi:molybdopterin synthase sulfur carrier subunit
LTVAVTVRLFAAAREVAGSAAVAVPAGTVAEVCDALTAAVHEERQPRMAALLGICTVLSDGSRYRSSDQDDVPDGATIDVLPPFAGG